MMSKSSKKTDSNGDEISQTLMRLKQSIDQKICGEEVKETLFPGLSLYRWEEKTPLICSMYEPSICIIAQGAKRVVLGENAYFYDSRQFLITSVHLPTVAQVSHATRENPYLGLRLKLNQREITQLMVDSPISPIPATQFDCGMVVGNVTKSLLDAFMRLLALLDSPQDIPILGPLIEREILYRLLMGPQGNHLRQIASMGSRGYQIARAIDWLKDNFKHSFSIKELASQFNMSTSTFHHHFRALTTMSPLQYQKWLRLNEARRLMLAENQDATRAAFEVGYESPSQFSREYGRLFGAPPLRDVLKLKEKTSYDQMRVA